MILDRVQHLTLDLVRWLTLDIPFYLLVDNNMQNETLWVHENNTIVTSMLPRLQTTTTEVNQQRSLGPFSIFISIWSIVMLALSVCFNSIGLFSLVKKFWPLKLYHKLLLTVSVADILQVGWSLSKY